MNGLVVFVALVALLAAVAMFLQSRSARQAAREREEQAEKLRRELDASHTETSALRVEAKDRRDEASSLRGELNSAKKKAFEQQEAAKKAGGAPALRAEIDKLSGRLAEARAEGEHHGERARSLEATVERQARELERQAKDLESMGPDKALAWFREAVKR